jgi:uncharacterized surface protein with fasciclin (FAS1) repeats
MKMRLWLMLAVAILLVAAPFAIGSMQDLEDPSEEPIEEYQYEAKDSLLSILATIVEVDSLDTLMYFLKISEMHKQIKDIGPYTLFAPSDSAFAKLSKKQIQRLTHDRKYAREVLARHIIKGKVVLFGEPEKLTLKTLWGDPITVQVSEDYVQVGHATVVDEAIECSNGVIHVIDAVLLPSKVKQKD